MQRLIAFLAALLVTLALVLPGPARAQEPEQPDYAAWTKFADQAEQTVEAGKASDERLQSIRAEVVKWRDRFQAAQGTNASRIATLKDQIAALGPPPAEGQAEAEDVAARRKELNQQLADLQAPGLKAVEAYGRADALVQRIDQTLRQRQTHALLRQTEAPVNPANWGPALRESVDLWHNVWTEFRSRWDDFGARPDATRRALTTLAFLVAALLLLSRGRHWVDSLPSRLSARASERSRAALIFAVSLGQIAIPLMGVLLGTAALVATDLFGEWGRPILLSVPRAGLSLFGGIWLARRMFPEPGTATTLPVPLPDALRRRAAFRAQMLAAAMALHQLFARSALPLSGFNTQRDSLTVPERLSEASAGVWHFLMILLGSFFLFQLCHILRRVRAEQTAETPDYRSRIISLLGRLGRLVAVAAPILAALGFVTGANALLWSTVLTLALAGLLVILQDFIADLYALAKGGDQSARDALMPVLISFALVVASLPLFALIWGARPSDLAEAWTRIQQGWSFGGVRLSPIGILTFLVVFGIGYFLTRFIQGAFRTSILPKTRLDPGGQNAVVSMLGYTGLGLAGLLAITSAGLDLSSLAIIAGALSVGLSFGMQQVVSNFVSGIILLIERPIAVGDWIEVGGKQGIVKKMAVRATQIETFDRTELIVPNSDLITQPVTNWTRTSLQGRIIVQVTITHASDSRRAAAILMDIAEDQPTVLVNPPPSVGFIGILPEGQKFEMRAILSDITGGGDVTTEINHQIRERFAAEGIVIAGSLRPARDVWLHPVPPEEAPPEPEAEPEPEAGNAPRPGAGAGQGEDAPRPPGAPAAGAASGAGQPPRHEYASHDGAPFGPAGHRGRDEDDDAEDGGDDGDGDGVHR